MQGGMNSVISPDENTKPDGSKTLLFVPDTPLRLFKERQQATVSLAGQTNFSLPPPGEKYVWSSAYSVLVQVRRNAGALFFSN